MCLSGRRAYSLEIIFGNPLPSILHPTRASMAGKQAIRAKRSRDGNTKAEVKPFRLFDLPPKL
ncbi:hypothetical protein CLAFUW4_03885 [Fulvia fulva]|uniref:Uncharacterized protein n=1 Tax=Passalora fulva TaxID=5499 RepID=A0A9Q8P564_PASFU|nr:uncharacterized protein CLAFUR5_03855 [Fulvia fulva]KAK4631877.1 hypothetical protein CLAFUR4_03873 [Fulvia fulva]KAK4633306.1 hypothetical protein CLAFUR0_03872 [Fulvia fulva]UJO13678.1 hypothetical protein CLAFUR5_03855 [Fulvia fulva]WPV11040.1 hypothetical protein CLAFUW4_03885 [Fulvia fulva]WPV26673.1 hypothetical protein CLAFUW7_03876 [Fulvia fulva]